MKNFVAILQAIDYIEQHLDQPLTQDMIAKECFCSLSNLQKLFRYAFHHSVKEYIVKRRLANATHDLAASKMSITQIAMKYQYNSPETFSRAFKKLWEVSPSEFMKQWRFTRIFPKITGIDYYNNPNGGREMKKKVDISEVYDALKEKVNTWVCCFDIEGLIPINDISYEAGDKAILEAAHRIEASSTEDMLLFRIGGDEFALVTGLSDLQEVEHLAQAVLLRNNQPFTYNEKEIPLALRVGIMQMPHSNLKYNELFSNMHNAINVTRKANRSIHILAENE